MNDETKFSTRKLLRLDRKSANVADVDLEVAALPCVANFQRDPQRRRAVQPHVTRGHLRDEVARLSSAAERLANEHMVHRTISNC